MPLAVRPPVAPMLAKLERELPLGGAHVFEPKWDGFRCLVFRDGDDIDLRSRHDRPFSRYFPEVVEHLRDLREERVVLDGELVVVRRGRPDFPALLERLHPAASRVAGLAARQPADLVVFDVLARGDDDLRGRPYERRRALLELILHDPPAGIRLTPTTTDRAEAAAWLDAADRGIDGVMVKARADAYHEGKRTMRKIKPEHTLDCVVGGVRLARTDEVGSLLLGLYAPDGSLHHVGVAASFGAARRRAFARELAPLARELPGHPWEHGFLVEGGRLGRLKGTAGRWTPDLPRDWEPLEPVAVCEVAYDHAEGDRLRHPARFRRWRPDRDPRSCTVAQLLEVAVTR